MKKFDFTNPDDLSEALALAKKWKTWAEAVEKAAKKHLTNGGKLKGWMFQKRNGRETISPSKAHEAIYSRMGSEKFMEACSVSTKKLRTIWEENFTGDFPAENLITRSQDTFALVENKQTDD